jgi:heme oxygenase
MTGLAGAFLSNASTIGVNFCEMPADFSARVHLRTGTATAHAELERQPALAALSAGALTPAGYAAVLRAFRGWYAMAEPWVGAHIGPLAPPDLAKRLTKTCRLQADLAALDGAEAEADSPLALSNPSGPRAALGVLYVMEGATLGGQLILRRLASDPTTEHLPRSFFTAYGVENGAMWRGFCAHLEASLPDPAVAEEAADAARVAFRSLDAAVAQIPPQAADGEGAA